MEESSENQNTRNFVGPWEDVAEFRQVFEWLFGESANNDSRHRSMVQMRIWQQRRGTMCPAAVLATNCLLRVQLKEGDTSMSQTDLQELYAFAVIRFFNFMSSTMQTFQHRTMYDTAKELGLQSFVVDLRHICSHSAVLPELSMLRSTAKYCMEWVRDYYWRPNCESMADVDASELRRKHITELDEKVTNLLQVYDTALECHMQSVENIKMAKRVVRGDRYNNLKQFCKDYQVESLETCLSHVTKELTTISETETDVKNMKEVLLEALQKMQYFYRLSANKHLQKLLKASRSLFYMVGVNGLVEEFFYVLFNMAEDTDLDSERRKGASFWATLILDGFKAFRKCKQVWKTEADENPNLKEIDFSTVNSEKMNKHVRKIVHASEIDLRRTLLFGDSFRRPWTWVFDRSFLEARLENISEFTTTPIKSLLNLVEPALNEEEVSAIHTLIDTLLNSNPNQLDEEENKAESEVKTYTAQDLLDCLNGALNVEGSPNKKPRLNREPTAEGNSSSFGCWSYAKDIDIYNWSRCPLGKLPWH